MDKFRSSASSADLAASITTRGPREVVFDVVALSDGGEGFRAAFDGEVVMLRVRDPWGEWYDAPLSIVASSHETLGVVEVAEIIGRSRRPSPTSSEALAASSEGVADAILASVAWGVTRVVVGCGGSATSDGGEGCYQVLRRAGGLEVEVTAATDITADFFGVLRYAEQKGVATRDLGIVEQRLEHLADRYERLGACDVRRVARTGAAGGLSAALYALGANLVSGFDEVAKVKNLSTRIDAASRVITGEGRLDEGSLEGKVVSGVCALTNEEQRVLVVCGSKDAAAARVLTDRHPWVQVADLVSRYGQRRAFDDTLGCVGEVVADFLANEP
jgi:glycerate kinase